MVKVSLWSTELGQLVFEFSKWFEGVELNCFAEMGKILDI